MTSATKWILAVVGLLAANLVAMGILIGAAQVGHSQVIPDYYNRAVHYDDAIDQAAKNRALGWKVTTRFDGTIVADVVDRDGHPLAGARVRIDAMPRVPGQTTGLHDLTITVERGADTYVEHTTMELP